MNVKRALMWALAAGLVAILAGVWFMLGSVLG